jgi:hypothetical protein
VQSFGRTFPWTIADGRGGNLRPFAAPRRARVRPQDPQIAGASRQSRHAEPDGGAGASPGKVAHGRRASNGAIGWGC